MATLTFRPASGGPVHPTPLSPASSILVALMKAGAPIRHDCGGKAICGTCRVSISDPRATSPLREAERLRLEALGVPLDGKVRLACQTSAFRDLDAAGVVSLDREERA